MKTLYLQLIIWSFLIYTSVAYAIPSGNVVQGQITTDSTVYSPGQIVKINVFGEGCLDYDNCMHQLKSIYLKVFDATTNLKGTSVLYQQTNDLVNNTAQFNFTTPKLDTSYRFLIQIYADSSYCCPLDSVYVVTKQGAEKITISDVNLLTRTVIPGQTINYTVNIKDGLGNKIPDFAVKGDLPQTDGSRDYLSSQAIYDNTATTYHGSIVVPKSWSQYPPLNGTYLLRVSASPPYTKSGYTNSENGISHTEDKSKSVQITVNLDCNQNPQNQFCLAKIAKIAQYHISNPGIIKPGSEVDYEVQVVDKQGNPINLEVDARLFYQASWGPSVSNSWSMAYDESKKVVDGKIGMPQDIKPGNYTIGLYLFGNNDMQKPDIQIPITVSDVSVVPEFPFLQIILIMSIMLSVVFYRIKFK